MAYDSFMNDSSSIYLLCIYHAVIVYLFIYSAVMHDPWDSRGWRCDVASGTLYIPKVQPEDAGHYNCRYCSQSSIDLRVGGKY